MQSVFPFGGRVAVTLFALLVSVAACSGEPVRPHRAERIVSLVPCATEMLFALGAGDRVVARSKWCDWPPEAKELPAAGDALTVSAEHIAGLRPVLVIVGGGTQREALAALAGRIEVRVVLPETVGEVRAALRELGSVVERGQRAEELVAAIDAAIADARRRAPGAGARVLFAVQREPLIVAGGGSCVGELIAALGAENTAGDLARPWPELAAESLVARDPTVILDASPEPGAAAFWARFHTLAAVRSGAVRVIRDPSLVRPGPRLPELLAMLERAIRGGAR